MKFNNAGYPLERKSLNEQPQINIHSMHDFKTKLLQPSILPNLKDYLRWQVELKQSSNPREYFSKMPNSSPISINIDPTSACNFSCHHCVDKGILNTGIQYDFNKLCNSLDLMHKKGLKSVIIIGGGEPLLYRDFENLVSFIKEKDMQVAVVTNGTGMEKIDNIAHLFEKKDWVRISLDSGTEQKFQEMHLPKGRMISISSIKERNDKQKERIPITLEQICRNVRSVKERYHNLTIGFAYIVTWPGAYRDNRFIESNLDEMVDAAYLAKEHSFDYLSLKAFLDRDQENNSEVIGINKLSADYKKIIKKISDNIELIKNLETNSFKLSISTNLSALLGGVEEYYKIQPKTCHITNFRQVLGIQGISICPVYRNEPQAKIGEIEGYISEENYNATRERTAERIQNFDASLKCKNVVCIYRDANWFFENLIQESIKNPRIIDELQPGQELNDYFL